MTEGEQKEQNKKREQSPTLYWTEHGLEVKVAFMQRYEPFLSG